MKIQKVRIEMTNLMHGKVFIDDVEVQRVQSVKFTAGRRQPNEVLISFLPEQVDIDLPQSLVTQIEAPQPPADPKI